MIPTAVPWGFCFYSTTRYCLFWDKVLRQFGNMSCQVLFSRVFFVQALHRRQANQTLQSTTPKIQNFSNYCLEIMSILEIFTHCRHHYTTEGSRVPPQNTKKKTHFSLVSLSVYPRSHRGAERIRRGEGRWSRPPKTALKRSDLTEKSPGSRIPY